MPIPDTGRIAVLTAVSGVLLFSAVSDIYTRRIPNLAVLALLALFAAWAVVTGGAGLGPALITGALALAVGYGLYAFGVMGGGDAKLFAATALFAGPAYLPAFALATVLTGGVMAVVSLASRPRRTAAMLATRDRGDTSSEIPYGVAIGIGGLLVLWGALFGNIAPFVLAPQH